MEFFLHKMQSEFGNPIRYSLNNQSLIVNNYIGKTVKFTYLGEIVCVSCGKQTKKSFNQGFCYTCFTNAPESAPCIVRPELCEAHLGRGRDVEWEESHHNQPHIVYLAASDVVKVGVTRETQIPTRWIDQGAKQAIILAKVPYRQLAGQIEVALKDQYTDKTNWQKMLKNELDESLDLLEEKWSVVELLPRDLRSFFTEDEFIYEMEYPVIAYPTKIKSFSFDNETSLTGKLIGIKGQYLLFEDGTVFNVRKHAGYKVDFTELTLD